MGEAEQNKWDLMAKVFAGEATSSEKDILDTWVNLDEDNKTMFEKSEKDWHAVEFQKIKRDINVESAWDKQFQRIQKSPGKLQKEGHLKISHNFLKMAASLVIIVALGFAGIRVFDKVSNRVITVSTKLNSETRTIILSDGSEVTLNDNSTLSYPKRFGENSREVRLTGEAFFDISRNASKPFIIHTEKADVKVLGTSFNVNTSLSEDMLEVFVYTGLVQVSDGKNPDYNMIVEPGQIGRFENNILVKQENTDKNYLAWKTKELFFKDAYLNDITKTLSKVYDVKIELADPKIGGCLYTSTNSTFVQEDLKDILNIICNTFNLEFTQKNNIYVIKGEGC